MIMHPSGHGVLAKLTFAHGIGANSIYELPLAQFLFLVTTSLSLIRLSEHSNQIENKTLGEA